MLASALEHYRRQQGITALGVAAARRAGDSARLLAVVTLFQEKAAEDAIAATGVMLDEQNLTAPLEARVNPQAFAGTASDGRPLSGLLEAATNLAVVVATQLQDAARVAAGVAITARPRVTGYVRMLNPPSCPRCAVLAGRFYGWNEGFQRHPLCDCRHVPTSEDVAGDLRTDPMAAFRAGEVQGLTVAETKAINEGADIARIVNARRSRYVDEAGHRLTREGVARSRLGIDGIRPTPEQIYRDAGDDRAAAIGLLRRFGYLL
jgi:hypothetical protein